MRRMLPARVAKLGELQPSRGCFLVLRRRIVPVLAIRTLQCNDLAHYDFLSSVASHLGWQAACFGSWSLSPPPDTPRRRVKVPATCIPEKLKRDSQAVRHTLVLIYYPRNRPKAEEERQASTSFALLAVIPQRSRRICFSRPEPSFTSTHQMASLLLRFSTSSKDGHAQS